MYQNSQVTANSDSTRIGHPTKECDYQCLTTSKTNPLQVDHELQNAWGDSMDGTGNKDQIGRSNEQSEDWIATMNHLEQKRRNKPQLLTLTTLMTQCG